MFTTAYILLLGQIYNIVDSEQSCIYYYVVCMSIVSQ